MDLKIRLPGALWRAAVTKAGTQGELNKIIVQAITDYVHDRNPLTDAARRAGHARAASMTPEQRSALARDAAAARWGLKPDAELEDPDLDPSLE